MNELEELDNDHLHQYLNTFDSKSALEIHPNNRKRVLRAIEYYLKQKTFKFTQESSTIYRKL